MRRRLLGVLYFARIGAMLAAIPLAGAIGVWSSWEHDNGALREKAVAVTWGDKCRGEDKHHQPLGLSQSRFYKERPLLSDILTRSDTDRGIGVGWGLR